MCIRDRRVCDGSDVRAPECPEGLAEGVGDENSRTLHAIPAIGGERLPERLDRQSVAVVQHGVETRMAAYLVAVNRVAEAVRARGWV